MVTLPTRRRPVAGASHGRGHWAHAAHTRAVVVTKDEDFATRRQLTPDGPPVVWIRFGNTTNPDLLLRMAAHLPNIVAGVGRGETLLEIS